VVAFDGSAAAEALAKKILSSMESPDIQRPAAGAMARCKALGFESDWDAVPEKMEAFYRVIFAASAVLPAGGSVETGVFRGGTSGPLILCDAPESFHIGIDPFGLAAQSYADLADVYGQWKGARATLAKLSVLGEAQNVTYCHHTMAASKFIACDLLNEAADFRIVHLDGDHSEQAVCEELAYFRRKIRRPALFVLDDHDTTYPGVETGMQRAGRGMAKVFHRFYDYPGFPTKLGFSAWVHAP
jgi:hypothetical protein